MNKEDKELIEVAASTLERLSRYIAIFNLYTRRNMQCFELIHIGILFDDMEECLKHIENQIKKIKY